MLARLPCFGWEMHLTSSVSDKYYRVLLIHNIVLVNYGRRAARGQVMVHVFSGTGAAQMKARDLTNQKAAEGYRVSRWLTSFEVSLRDHAALLDSPVGRRSPGDTEIQLIDRFKNASSIQHTALEGASA